MNIVHMKYAVEVAKTQSISKAAENLYMGQPNLSRAIRELEESLGITIFERTTRGITVTPDGEEFLQYARSILKQVDEVEAHYRGSRMIRKFSVCVPRANYVARALENFIGQRDKEIPFQVFYKETNAMRAIDSVVKDESNMAVVRYQAAFSDYYQSMFVEKNLENQLVAEFHYVLLCSADSPLARAEAVTPDMLRDYVELAHADPYAPGMPVLDAKKAEMSQYTDKHVYVFERGSQFELLSSLKDTFMWVSPIPQDALDRWGLVQRPCSFNRKIYKDVLVYKKGHKLSDMENSFIDYLVQAKHAILDREL